MYPWFTPGHLAATSIWQATVLLHTIWCYDQHSSLPICILKSRADHQPSPCRQYMLPLQQFACRPKQAKVLPRALRAPSDIWRNIRLLPCLFSLQFLTVKPSESCMLCGQTLATFALGLLAGTKSIFNCWLCRCPTLVLGFSHWWTTELSFGRGKGCTTFKLCIWIYCWEPGEVLCRILPFFA